MPRSTEALPSPGSVNTFASDHELKPEDPETLKQYTVELAAHAASLAITRNPDQPPITG